jgi:murein L,D-transpeptidase YcbB/YkuD
MTLKDRQFIKEDTLNLDTLFSKKENISIPLENKIPIYIEYETVLVQKKQLLFLEDIYGRDEEYLRIWQEN